MSVKSTWRALISLVVLLSLVALQNLSTAEGLFHEISGVVKHVDKPLMGPSTQSNGLGGLPGRVRRRPAKASRKVHR